MVEVPKPTPEICACVAGATAPAAMVTLGVTVTEGSLLVRVTVIPPDGAGVDNVTGNGTTWPGTILTFAGKVIVPGLLAPATMTVALASVMLGELALAVIEADPAATPVTGTLALAVPAGIVTLAGTVATPVLFESRPTMRFVGVTADRLSVKFWTAAASIFRLGGAKLNAAFT